MKFDGIGGYFILILKCIYQAWVVVVVIGFYDILNMMDVLGEDFFKVKYYYDDVYFYVGQEVFVVGVVNFVCQVVLELWCKGVKVMMVIWGNVIYKGVKYWIKFDIENCIKEGSILAYWNSMV